MDSEKRDYSERIAQVRADRVAQLDAAGGWLRLVGLEWLKPGENLIGSAADNDLRLSKGPPQLGTITQAADGNLTMIVKPGSDALINGKAFTQAELPDDSHPQPSEISCGPLRIFLIDRAGRKATRVEDSEAPSRSDFRGLEYFPLDPSWLIQAQWQPFSEPMEIEILSVTGTLEKQSITGKAVFQRDDRTYELLAIQESPDSLFFIFGDLTSGKETYGGGRYLDASNATAGIVSLDFNLARNPPCAFTPYATCPLAPPENRLNLRVAAGEKTYRAGQEH
jgi:uncharacterized protein (DUF1684 family)